MVLAFATKLFGSSNDRVIKRLVRYVAPINALEPEMEKLSDEQIKAKAGEFKARFEGGESLDDLLSEAFAVVREAAKRTLGQRHYDVQLMGGVAMHQGIIAEMKTGEGKTLVSTLPAYLNAISGKGVHIVTVNDYLASRDADWMRPVYAALGLTVDCIVNGKRDEDRRAAYEADITYATNNELGFDYLRDNMKFSLDQMVQRDFNFAIIDEIDSILIDEARTPLIISGPSESNMDLYRLVDKVIPSLDGDDFEKDEKHKTIVLTESGTEKIEQLLRDHNILRDGELYDFQNINIVHHVNQALRAHQLFYVDKDYIVKDNRIVLIDEFTGRMMDGRRLSEGLHQAIEAKENVEIQNENQTLASITFQNFFRLYPKLSGMTGTAMTEAGEFEEIYQLGVVAIPTNRPIARLDREDKIYKSLDDKDKAVIRVIKECAERGQPILVGTVSIEKSEQLSNALKKANIKHNVLNARHHENEAAIIAQAGRPSAVTLATNMAGRGTDIQLGGNADMRISEEIDASWSQDKKDAAIAKINAEVAAAKQSVLDAGGLYVIGTERHESRRIDNQLRGRSGRQGDPGETIFFLSVEDDLMRIFAGDKMEMLLANKRIGLKDGEALEHPLISKMLERAQAKVESMHFDIRKNLLKFDDVMNDQRKVIYEQRREIMDAENVAELVGEMREDVISDTVNAAIPRGSYAEQWDIDALHTETARLLALDLPLSDWAREEGIADEEIEKRITDAADSKMAAKLANYGEDIWRRIEKMIVLQMLDQHWKDHLLQLDHLRQGINLRAFGQRDPLNEYKAEAFAMFENMLDRMRETITMTLSIVELGETDGGGMGVYMPGMMPPPEDMHTTRQDPAMRQDTQELPPKENPLSIKNPNATPHRKPTVDLKDPETWKKTPRNALCPCGSTKKYKHCHGKL